VVWATSAAVWGEGEPQEANFLMDGPHWEEFRRRFEKALKRPPEPEVQEPKPSPIIRRPERPRTPPPPSMTLILGVPDDISFDLAEAALEASRRIREERQLVFEHEILLHYRDGDLKLRPLRGSADDLRAPFAYTRINGVRNVRGVIALSGAEDPLAVRLDSDSAGPLTGVIWACARWVGSVRRECLDRILIVSRRQLETVLREYVAYHNTHRPHRSLEQQSPLAQTVPIPAADHPWRVRRRDRLGGLLHEDELAA
jgi:hypothetical protein